MTPIRQVRFNQDFSCFISCGIDGLRLFSVDPLMQLTHIKEEKVGIVVKADILRRTNLLALSSRGSENTVKIWDCASNKLRREITFHQQVTNIRFHHDKLLVVLLSQIISFSISPEIRQLTTYDTRDNPLGLIALNSGVSSQIMAFPGLTKAGYVQVSNIQYSEASVTLAPVTIAAHEHELACITLNMEGSLLASASRHGTLVRVYDVNKRVKLMELRRGSDTALVYTLNFSPDSNFLCAASDKGTVHIFAVVNSFLNRRSAIQRVGSVFTQLTESQLDVTSFTVPAEMACVAAFLPEQRSAVVVICVDGSYHKYLFKQDGGCTREAYDRFIELGDNMEM